MLVLVQTSLNTVSSKDALFALAFALLTGCEGKLAAQTALLTRFCGELVAIEGASQTTPAALATAVLQSSGK